MAHSILMQLADASAGLLVQVERRALGEDNDVPEVGAKPSETRAWALALHRHCRGALDELEFLAPLPDSSLSSDAYFDSASIPAIPTLRWPNPNRPR